MKESMRVRGRNSAVVTTGLMAISLFPQTLTAQCDPAHMDAGTVCGEVYYKGHPAGGVKVQSEEEDHNPSGLPDVTDSKGHYAIQKVTALYVRVTAVVFDKTEGALLRGSSPIAPPPLERVNTTGTNVKPIVLSPSGAAPSKSSENRRQPPGRQLPVVYIQQRDVSIVLAVAGRLSNGRRAFEQSAPQPVAEPFRISGTVTSAGTAAASIDIELLATRGTKDELLEPAQVFTKSILVSATGEYQFTFPQAGVYSMTGRAQGCEPTIKLIEVSEARGVEVCDENGKCTDGRKLALPLMESKRGNVSRGWIDLEPPVDVSSPTLLAIFDGPASQALPLSGWRSADALALLVPGVSPAPLPVGLPVPGIIPGIGTPGEFSVNGLRPHDNSFTVDGSDDNDEENGARRQGLIADFPQPFETLREFTIVTALANATYGHGSAGQIDALSNSGKKEFHGQIWGFGTAGAMNAQNAFHVSSNAYPLQFQKWVPITANGLLPATLGSTPSVFFGTANSPTPLQFPVGADGSGMQSNPTNDGSHFRRAQTGFQFGGPILRKETTYTVSYERRTVRESEQTNFAVPTAVQRQICPVQQVPLGTPTVAGTPPGTACGSTNYPVTVRGDAIWSLYPFPNNPLGPYGANTFTENLPSDGNANLFMGQIDHHFETGRTRQSIIVRINATNEGSVLPETGDALFSSVKPVIATENGALYFNSSFAHRFANTLRMSYGATQSKFNPDRDPYLSPSTRVPGDQYLLNAPLLLNTSQSSPANGASQIRYTQADSTAGLGIINSVAPQGYFVPNGSPIRYADQVDLGYAGEVLVGGFSSLGVNPNQLPEKRGNSTWQVADTATKVFVAHMVHFGVDIRNVRLASSATPNSRPIVDFQGLWDTYSPSPVALSAMSLASIGVGTTTQTFGLYGSTAPNPSLDLRTTQAELFVQDDYAPVRTLHFNWGIRFQHAGLPRDVSGHFEQAFDGQLLQTANNQCAQGAALPGGFTACQLLPVLNSLMPNSYQSVFSPKAFSADGRAGFAWDPWRDGKTAIRGGVGLYSGQFPGVLADEARNDFPNFLTISGAPTTTLANSYYSNQGLRIQDNGMMFLQGISQFEALSLLAHGPASACSSAPGQSGPCSPSNPGYNSLSAQLIYPAPGLANSYSIQSNLTIERQITSVIVVSAAYVGTEGRNLLNTTTPLGGPNRSSVSFPVTMPNDGTSFSAPSGTTTFAPSTQVGGATGWSVSNTLFGDSARSSYHAAQVGFRAQSAKGLQLSSGLTWSHSIDDASDFAALAGAFPLPQDSHSPSERGSSNFDVRLRSVTYFGVNSSAFCQNNRYCKEFTLSGIVTLQSAQPYTINTALDVNEDGNATDRPNNTSGLLASSGPRAKWLPVTAPEIAQMLASPGEDGALGRNTFRAWGLYNADVALSRKFSWRETRSLQVRIEVFNILNHPNLGIPVRILEAPSFGQATSTVTPPRIVQMALKYSF